ncbi:MAG: glycosyltransferase family 4 protein [Pseudomonadota bacterium]
MKDHSTSPRFFHHPDVVGEIGSAPIGRHVAGRSLLAGYIEHGNAETLYGAVATAQDAAHFKATAEDQGWVGPFDIVMSHHPEKLVEPGILMLPGPSLGPSAWTRRRVTETAYSLCGITHTVATERIMTGLFDTLIAPVRPWDAIIATSRAVRETMMTELDAAETYLKERFQGADIPRPQVPVIPLGIDAPAFQVNEGARERERQRLNMPSHVIVVMTVARLSVFEKMHPAPLMIALERACQQTGLPVILCMAGWFPNEEEEQVYRACASAFAPGVDVRFIDASDSAHSASVRAAADIFVMPVDNIQETFGLAVVEAMAAGLPVVCSDWNGLRDTVQHGETGFRVPTLMVPPDMGDALARRYEHGVDTYLQYLSLMQQRTALNIPAMADALAALIGNPDLRKRMGAAGRARVLAHFDWSAVIPQYQALWQELDKRRAAADRADHMTSNPAAMDPTVLYRGYPTAALNADAFLDSETALDVSEVAALFDLLGNTAINRSVASPWNLARISSLVCDQGPLTVSDVINESGLSVEAGNAAILWLVKFDLITIQSPWGEGL